FVSVGELRRVPYAVYHDDTPKALPHLTRSQHGDERTQTGAGSHEPQLTGVGHVAQREEPLRLVFDPNVLSFAQREELRRELALVHLGDEKLERRAGRGSGRVRAAGELALMVKAQIEELARLEARLDIETQSDETSRPLGTAEHERFRPTGLNCWFLSRGHRETMTHRSVPATRRP